MADQYKTPKGKHNLFVPMAPKRPTKRKFVLKEDDDVAKKLFIEEENAKDGFENNTFIEKCEKRQENVPMCQLDIGKNCYVVLKPFKGELYVHVRVYEKRSDESTFPSKQGIALTLEHWKKIDVLYSSQVDEAISQYEDGVEVDYFAHLGRNIRVTLKTGYPVVHIRRWFLPEGEKEIKPTRKGIALDFKQWEKLKDSMVVIKDLIGDELEQVEFCENSGDHQNQMGALQCPNCNPNWCFDMVDF